MDLDADDRVDPEGGTVRVVAAVVASRDAQSPAGVRRGRLVVARKAVEGFEAADVTLPAVEDADLPRGPKAETAADQVAGIERDTEHELGVPPQVDPTAHTEPEEPEAGALVAGAPQAGGWNSWAPSGVAATSIASSVVVHALRITPLRFGVAPPVSRAPAAPDSARPRGRSPKSRTVRPPPWPRRVAAPAATR